MPKYSMELEMYIDGTDIDALQKKKSELYRFWCKAFEDEKFYLHKQNQILNIIDRLKKKRGL